MSHHQRQPDIVQRHLRGEHVAVIVVHAFEKAFCINFTPNVDTDEVSAHCPKSSIVQVPWASLGRSPVLVEVDRLYILAGPKEEKLDDDDTTTEAFLLPPLNPPVQLLPRKSEEINLCPHSRHMYLVLCLLLGR